MQQVEGYYLGYDETKTIDLAGKEFASIEVDDAVVNEFPKTVSETSFTFKYTTDSGEKEVTNSDTVSVKLNDNNQIEFYRYVSGLYEEPPALAIQIPEKTIKVKIIYKQQ